MDTITVIAVVAGIASILGLLYVAFIGQKTIPEWWRQRTGPKTQIGPTPQPLEATVQKIPHNLPPRGEFIGREKEKQRVFEGLASSYPVVAIEGLGGMGKTALARQVAWICTEIAPSNQAREQVPQFDAVIWTEDRHGNLTLEVVLDAIARVLEQPHLMQLPREDKLHKVIQQLQETRCLVIVDNFETVTDNDVVDFVIRIPEPPSKALITSREKLLRGAWAIGLGRMEKEDAFALIRAEGKRLGLVALENSEPQTLSAFYEATGGNPLAIRLTAGQIKDAGFSLDVVLGRLVAAEDEELFGHIFRQNWDELLQDDESAKRVLMAISIFPGTATKEAIETVSDVHHAYLRASLKRLVELSLVDVSGELIETQQRYSIHPLTRAFAKTQRELTDEHEAMHYRYARYFLDHSKRFGGYYNLEGMYELEKEHESILAAFDWCCAVGQRDLMIEFGWQISYYLWVRGYWAIRIKVCRRVYEASKRENDLRSIAWAAYDTGQTYFAQGHLAEAQWWAIESQKALVSTEYAHDARHPLVLQLLIAQKMGDLDALPDLQQAIDQIQHDLLRTPDAATTKMGLGDLARAQGNHVEASRWYQEALVYSRRLKDFGTQATALYNLGECALDNNTLSEAQLRYEESLDIAQQYGIAELTARCELGLAMIAKHRKDPKRARQLLDECVPIFQQLGAEELLRQATTLRESAGERSNGS